MVASQDDPFTTNPYVAPEMLERVVVDRALHPLGSVWKWMVAVSVIEAAMTLLMVTLHGSSPRVRGINVFAIANLFLSGVLSIVFAWWIGRRSSGLRTMLIAQFMNLLIWLTFGSIIYFHFGIHWSGEGKLLLLSFFASAMLTLIATQVSIGVFRSRSGT